MKTKEFEIIEYICILTVAVSSLGALPLTSQSKTHGQICTALNGTPFSNSLISVPPTQPWGCMFMGSNREGNTWARFLFIDKKKKIKPVKLLCSGWTALSKLFNPYTLQGLLSDLFQGWNFSCIQNSSWPKWAQLAWSSQTLSSHPVNKEQPLHRHQKKNWPTGSPFFILLWSRFSGFKHEVEESSLSVCVALEAAIDIES